MDSEQAVVDVSGWTCRDSLLDHVPKEHENWELTDADTTRAVWWRKGSTYATTTLTYERLTLHLKTGKGRDRWAVSKRTFDEFRNSLSGITLSRYYCVDGHTDALGTALTEVVKRMDEFPGGESFDGEPRFPNTVGLWENEVNKRKQYIWRLDENEVRIEFAENRGKSEVYKVVFSDGDREYVVPGRAPLTNVMKSVVAFMGRFPKGDIAGSELFEKLLSVDGVGKVWAVKLLVAGVDESAVDSLSEQSPSAVGRDALRSL